MQTLRNQVGVGAEIAARIAKQQCRKRRIVVDDDSTFTIDDSSPRRQHGDVANAVLFRSQRIKIALHDLQAPQSVGQNEEDAEDDVLCRRQADGRDFFIAAEHQFSVAGCHVPVQRWVRALRPQPVTILANRKIRDYPYCNAFGRWSVNRWGNGSHWPGWVRQASGNGNEPPLFRFFA